MTTKLFIPKIAFDPELEKRQEIRILTPKNCVDYKAIKKAIIRLGYEA